MSTITKSLRSDSRQTREDILAASVALFSEQGFAQTSMRRIADRAGVNLALINYHFGSKLHLFEASFHHCAAPINAERIRQLDALESTVAEPTVEQIVRAFVDVGVIGDANWSALIARVFVEPDTISQPILERAFASTVQRFLQALHKALPGLSADQIDMRFHFLVGSMLHLIRFTAPLGFAHQTGKRWDSKQSLDELVDFVVAGMCRGTH